MNASRSTAGSGRARKNGAIFNFAGLSIMRAMVHYARGTLVEAEADTRDRIGDRQKKKGHPCDRRASGSLGIGRVS